MWNDCIHHGAHVVDLTWQGAIALVVSFFLGYFAGRPWTGKRY